ncbi:MAG: L,D-transpeptidase, partial [Mariprofundaceae bacterium]|nr:L,D-transpeptidase [Mariprofundaceae bacterium]
MVVISISDQRLYHRRPSGVWHAYPVSTALAGCGNRRDSLQTPLGKHRIGAKIGEGMPVYTAFIGRDPVG